LGNKEENMTVFGRAEAQQLLAHPSISRQHCAIVHAPEGLVIMDLQSTHGTYVNEQKLTGLQTQPLYNKDVIRFGGSSRKYKVKGSIDAPTATTTASNNNDNNTRKRPLADAAPRITEAKKRKVHVRVVRHILIKHTTSRRPICYGTYAPGEQITRTAVEATTLLNQIHSKQTKQQGDTSSFSKLARTYSDCESAFNDGLLGIISPSSVFYLKDHQIHELQEITTEHGYHLVYRES
jgi:predicted component of type VI protein secretion system